MSVCKSVYILFGRTGVLCVTETYALASKQKSVYQKLGYSRLYIEEFILMSK